MNSSVANGGTEPRRAEREVDSSRRRTLSALVLAPIVLAAAWAGGWVFTALIALAALIMAYEWDRLCRGQMLGAVGVTSAAAILLALALGGAGQVAYALLAAAVGAGLVAVVALIVGRHPLWSALGVAYVGLPCVSIIWLRASPEAGRETIIWLLTLVWATDIGAYLVGRAIGGPRMAVRISPGKTWSGLAGGMICAALAGAAVARLTGTSGIARLAMLSAALAVPSQLRDVAESSLQRHFGVKDSGTLIPGHGGVLDRVDGLVFAALGVGALTLVGGASPLLWP